MPTCTTNGRPQRKQLSDQIDRLDTILDGLSDALNGAVAEAVRDGTRLALKDAIIEILTDPTLRVKLQHAASPAPTPSPSPSPQPIQIRQSFAAWLKAKGTALANGAKAAAATVAQTAAYAAQAAVSVVRNPSRLVQMIASCKQLFYIGAAAGLAVAVVSFFAPHIVSAALSGISGGIAAIAVQAALWTRRTLQAFTINLA